MSANVVGKRVLHVKHGRSASPRVRRRGESGARAEEVQLCVASDCEWITVRREGHALPSPEPQPQPFPVIIQSGWAVVQPLLGYETA